MAFLDRDKYGMYKKSGSHGPGPALMGADTLLGEDVVNTEEAALGDIKEIMIDMRTGQVAYAVLAFHGMFGMGEKLFAVPWQAMALDTDKKRFVVDIDKDRLKEAPGFNPDAWPDMDDVNWAAQINTFYGVDLSSAGGSMNMPGSMVGSPTVGAGVGSMGAGHAGTGAGAGAGSLGSTGGAGVAEGDPWNGTTGAGAAGGSTVSGGAHGGKPLGGSTTGGALGGAALGDTALGGSTTVGGSSTLGGAAEGTTGTTGTTGITPITEPTLDNGSSSGISGTGLNKDGTGGGGGL
jgi:sporulation protein YlmC with PRC-barrel domain